MKNTDKKWQVQRKQNSFASAILIIAIVAIIGLGFAACGDDTGGNGTGGNNLLHRLCVKL